MHVFNSHEGQLDLHMPSKLLVDNFAGGGGASMGIEMAFGRPVDIAINHDKEAIAMHTVNHPNTRHYCEDVWDVDPSEITAGNSVEFGWFSPDCKHFSRAKGSVPVEKNIRGLAWVAVRWGMKTDMEGFMLENVEEFMTWGPLDAYKKPCKARKSETFNGFLLALSTGLKPSHGAWRDAVVALGIQYKLKDKMKIFRGLGYQVEYRVRKACDLGAPTTRKRFYLKARRDGLPIVWADSKYAEPNSLSVQAGKLKAYKPAYECIDFSIPCRSIFGRKKPLAPKTMARIARGIKRFVIDNSDPFIVTDKASDEVSDRSDLCMAFLVQHYGGNYSGSGIGLNNPMGTITTVDHHALVTSHLVKFRGNETGQELNRPMPTITAGGLHLGEVRAFLIKYYGSDTGQSLNDPLHTVTTNDRFGLVMVHGSPYQIVDIAMRMLKPHELYKGQGFPSYYIHDRYPDGSPLTQKAQVKMCGNSVSPIAASEEIKAYLSASIKPKEEKKDLTKNAITQLRKTA